MADRAIVDTSTESAPKDYQLTGAQQLLVKAVRAEIDGSGAAGSYVPTLQQLAPDGQVMWEAPQDTTLAAGASADVSWFPRGVKRSGGGGGGSGVLAHGFGNVAQNFPAGTHSTVGMGSTNTSNGSVLSWSTSVNPNDTLTASTTGTAMCITSALINVSANQDIFVNANSAGMFRHNSWLTNVPSTVAPPEGFSTLMDQVWVNCNGAGFTFQVIYVNDAAFDNGFQQLDLVVMFFPGVFF